MILKAPFQINIMYGSKGKFHIGIYNNSSSAIRNLKIKQVRNEVFF